LNWEKCNTWQTVEDWINSTGSTTASSDTFCWSTDTVPQEFKDTKRQATEKIATTIKKSPFHNYKRLFALRVLM